MDAARWQQIKALLGAALDLPRADRAGFLDRECAGDTSLRAEVESLLAANDAADGFLETSPVVPVSGFLEAAEPPSRIGLRVGAYAIVEEIARGGMGEVYRAVRADDQFRKQVAVKLLRPGLDAAFVLDRFRAERQILASLDHPNIARLIDGGVTGDGLPYFVMELIEGEPIDAYCETHRLSIAARIELFRAVCEAVHYAHQRLVVHRDIKPSNILVAADGTPKLLDFGIARLVDEGESAPTAPRTLTEFRALTPEYASPEQIRGEPVTTASDVYSLGVLLYRLIAGRSPYRADASRPLDLAREILEQDPPRPSAAVGADGTGEARRLQRQLRGDLDTIVLHALRKDPARRYGSAERLAEDLRRHLAGLPVEARPDTWTYRAAKFLRRHAVAVAATVLVFASLVGGIVLALHSAEVARHERDRAQTHFNNVRRLANAALIDVHDAIQPLPGSTPIRRRLVEQARAYLDALAEESGSDPNPGLQRELASAYEKVGDVQGGFRLGGLGNAAGALSSYNRALSIRQDLYKADPSSPELLRALAQNHAKLGDVLVRLGRPLDAVKESRATLPLAERLAELSPADLATQITVMTSRVDLAANLGEARQWDEALAHCLTGADAVEKIAAAHPEDARFLRYRALVAGRLAWIYLEGFDDPAQAAVHYRRMLSLLATATAREPNHVGLRVHTATGHVGLAEAEARQGRFAEARRAFRNGIALLEAIVTSDPANANARFQAASALSTFGEMLSERSPAQARQVLRKALTHLDALPEQGHADTRTHIVLALAQARLGSIPGAARAAGKRTGDCRLLREAAPVLADAAVRRLLTATEAAVAERTGRLSAACPW